MEIYKASAGSGKTYTLAHKYLDLLRDEYSYKHILAVTFTNKATAEMKERILTYLHQDPAKRKFLQKILHDYSAFSVSTIDRFFQQALKAFAREIGRPGDYQVELDKNSLIEEAMDGLLDSLTDAPEHRDMLDWLASSVENSLEKGEKPSIERTLHQTGISLKSEERRRLEEATLFDVNKLSRVNLAKAHKSCISIIKDFAGRVRKEALALPEFNKEKADKQRLEYTGVVWYKTIEHPQITLSKAAAGTPFMDIFDKEYKFYATALIVDSQILSLGLAREFFAAYEELIKEKNVLPIDDSTVLLKKIISGSDAPFIYEKLGVRYQNFLLDEFQDTSVIQWENFLPLLKESDASGHNSLIVGDVKQSIYRFRDSDWNLLEEEVQKVFPGASVVSKQENYRSCKQIVGFNNAFFKFAASHLGLSGLYSDVEQNPMLNDTQQGHVTVTFCEKDDEAAKVMEAVNSARERGARCSDIAVLVRTNSLGAQIAAGLISKGIPVISDDFLLIKSSSIVQKLIALLSCIDNPQDSINAFIAQETAVEITDSFRSLTDLCENMLRQLSVGFPEQFACETPFIEAFMDFLREWTDVNGDNLRYFLGYWDKQKDKESISSPEDADAVRVLTVHKAKGLEFPCVIFPFIEDVKFYKEGKHWCALDAKGTPFDETVSGIYSVLLSSKSENTLFADDYAEEKAKQNTDNLNVFYVALTRASRSLHIIGEKPHKTYRAGNPRNFSQLLHDHCGGDCEYGDPYDFSKLKRRIKEPSGTLENVYRSIDLAGRLSASQEAADFFGEDGLSGIEASPRRSGIVLHGIMSHIDRPEDLTPALEDALAEGLLNEKQAEDARTLLSARIAGRKDFFAGNGRNEASIFDSSGGEQRPDRVIISGSKAVIIDYKFGEESEKYAFQLRRYMRIYRELGYGEVEGYIWYVMPDKLVIVQ